MIISPMFMMRLIDQVEKTMWKKLISHVDVEAYIKRWHEDYDSYDSWENFHIENDNGKIDLLKTLRGIEDDELVLKIAVDLGIEVPGLIYSIPELKCLLASDYETAASTFENAYRKVTEEPATSVVCANSALESIIKHICDDPSIANCEQSLTLHKLFQHILKEFKCFPSKGMQKEINAIGSGLLTAVQNIEAIRSRRTDTAHGKTSRDYIIDDDLYAKFVVNAVTTVGLFLMNFYEKKYLPERDAESSQDDEIPF